MVIAVPIHEIGKMGEADAVDSLIDQKPKSAFGHSNDVGCKVKAAVDGCLIHVSDTVNGTCLASLTGQELVNQAKAECRHSLVGGLLGD